MDVSPRIAVSREGANLIQKETKWRAPPQLSSFDGRPLRVGLSRWTVFSNKKPVEVYSDSQDDSHVLSTALRKIKAELFIGGRSVWRGGAQGEILLTGPRQGAWRGSATGDIDNFRVFLPQALMAECYVEAFGHPPSETVSLLEATVVEDDKVRYLLRAFRELDGSDGLLGPCLADSLALALASRLIQLGSRGGAFERTGIRLDSPRIRRVIDFIETRLERPIYLHELSEIAGLSRLQFAAQFKNATGHPPYAYVLHRKVERAKAMLLKPDATVVGVALDLGFCSQGHFTEAFRKTVGVTPSNWQKSAESRA